MGFDFYLDERLDDKSSPNTPLTSVLTISQGQCLDMPCHCAYASFLPSPQSMWHMGQECQTGWHASQKGEAGDRWDTHLLLLSLVLFQVVSSFHDNLTFSYVFHLALLIRRWSVISRSACCWHWEYWPLTPLLTRIRKGKGGIVVSFIIHCVLTCTYPYACCLVQPKPVVPYRVEDLWYH